jgi:spermidine synthase
MSLAFSTIIFITGSCNLIYELCLAQMTSSFFGGTLYHYALNIGLFILSMGAGSLAAEKISDGKVASAAVWTEFFIFSLALTMPFYTLFAEIYLPHELFIILMWLTNMLLGFCSGLELPLFNRLFRTENKTSKILFADYVGMFCGSLAFSFLLFPVTGVFGALWMAAFLNVLVLFVLLLTIKKFSGFYLALILAAACGSVVLILNSESLMHFLQGKYVS